MVLASIVYAGFLSNPYIFDDISLFSMSGSFDDVMPEHRFAWLELRSLPYASFSWINLIFGQHIEYLRIGNLLLHVGVAVAVYFAIHGLLQITVPEHTQKSNFSLIAWTVALVFVVHPAATYAVGYLVQRTILMATLFSLLAIIFYIRASMTGSRFWLWMVVPAYYLAIFSKEHAIMLPLCLAALTVLIYENWVRQLRREAAFFAVLVGMAITVFYFRKDLVGTLYEPNAAGYMDGIDPKAAYLYSIISQATLYFKYFLLWVLPKPNWMSIDMRESFATSLISWQAVGAISYLVYGFIGVRLLVRRGLTGLVGFAMLFPWLMFSTEFSAVRIQEIFVIYRSYLWSFGWLLMLAVVLLKAGSKKSSIIVVGIVVTFVLISLERLQTLAHPSIMWDDAAKLIEKKDLVRGAERIYYNRGNDRAKLGQFEGAKSDYEKTLSIYPFHIEARGNLGALYFNAGQWQNAIDQFNELEKYGQVKNAYMHPRLVFARAIAYEKLGQSDLAQKDFIRSCEMGKLGCEHLNK